MLRTAKKEDAPAIAAVHVETWRVSYSGIVAASFLDSISVSDRTKRWQSILETQSQTNRTTVFESDEKVRGFVSIGSSRTDDWPDDGEVYALYVEPACQGKGIGRALLKEALGQLLTLGFCDAFAWVLKQNPALAFYEKLGGRQVGSGRYMIGDQQLDEVALRWQLRDADRDLGG